MFSKAVRSWCVYIYSSAFLINSILLGIVEIRWFTTFHSAFFFVYDDTIASATQLLNRIFILQIFAHLLERFSSSYVAQDAEPNKDIPYAVCICGLIFALSLRIYDVHLPASRTHLAHKVIRIYYDISSYIGGHHHSPPTFRS